MRGPETAQWTTFWPLRHRFLPFDRAYLENGNSERYTSISALTSARRELPKSVSHGAIAAQRRPHKAKYVAFFEHRQL